MPAWPDLTEATREWVHEDRGVKMKRMAVLLSAASILFVSSGANAETVFVAKVPNVQTWPNGAAILEFRHGDNPGRAWVSATLCGRYFAGDPENSDCRRYNQYDFRVPGLTYDRSLGEIRLGSHVCARSEPGLLNPVDRQTGQCTLGIHTVRQEDDSGVQTSWRPMDVIDIRLR
jgi:hypothetical protein